MSAYILDVTGEVTVCKQSFIVNSAAEVSLRFHAPQAMTVMILFSSREERFAVVTY